MPRKPKIDKAGIDARLKRVRGQVDGINRMVQADRDVLDTLAQIAAAQRALDAVALQLLEPRLDIETLEAVKRLI